MIASCIKKLYTDAVAFRQSKSPIVFKNIFVVIHAFPLLQLKQMVNFCKSWTVFLDTLMMRDPLPELVHQSPLLEVISTYISYPLLTASAHDPDPEFTMTFKNLFDGVSFHSFDELQEQFVRFNEVCAF